MTKPVAWTTVYTEIVVRRTDVKELLEAVIEDILTDSLIVKDEILSYFQSNWDALEKEKTKLANFILTSPAMESYRNDLEDYIENLVSRSIKNGSYDSDTTFYLYEMEWSDKDKLKKILRKWVVESAFIPTKDKKPVKKETKKEDPCLTELKKMAKNLGYKLTKE